MAGTDNQPVAWRRRSGWEVATPAYTAVPSHPGIRVAYSNTSGNGTQSASIAGYSGHTVYGAVSIASEPVTAAGMISSTGPSPDPGDFDTLALCATYSAAGADADIIVRPFSIWIPVADLARFGVP